MRQIIALLFGAIRKVTNTKKSFSKVYLTPFGLYDNMYARKVTKQIIADDLFKKG